MYVQCSKLNTKVASGGSPVEWHQDWAFYLHTNGDMLAVGVMLSDVGAEDGALKVVPSSYRRPLLSHLGDGVFRGAIDPDDPEARLDEALKLTGMAGSAARLPETASDRQTGHRWRTLACVVG